jgi:phage terminase large subunit-like protein
MWQMPRRRSLADNYIAWIEAHCITPEGRNVGKPIVLREWQREIIRGIYDSPTRRAIISFARKSGKSSLSAMILLLHLIGPASRPNSQLFSAAQSRDQAAIVFNLCQKMVRMNPDLSRYVAIRDTTKQLYCPELGTLYRALSADASTAYGLSPVLVIFDELGQVHGPRSELFEALVTASAAHENPLDIIISTQAATDNDLLSILIDDAAKGNDPKTKLFLYTAPDGIDLFSDEALMAANPAAGDFANMDELRALAADAKRMPSREAEYLNLVLNMRVEAISPFISKSVWDINGGDVSDLAGYPIYCGLDLSETQDLTSLVMVAKIGDQWHVRPTFWLPRQGLEQKARKDRVPYDLWYKQGHLETTPGSAVEYSYVAQKLRTLFETHDIRAVAFDRYGMRHLRPWLTQCGFTDAEQERFQDFGQGFVSMSPAIREMEALLLNGKIRHAMHPVLTMCAANAVTESDAAGNRKLSKKRSRGRIDGLVALTMALAVATTQENKPKAFVSIFDDPEMFPELHRV